jgi:hypothetical protein
MEAKQKVTLYLPNQVHSQLKIRAAIDQKSMSELTEQAVTFYLTHPDIVKVNGIGHIHQVYNCPACTETLVIRKGELYAVSGEKTNSKGSTSSSENAKNNILNSDQDIEIIGSEETDVREQINQISNTSMIK